MKKLIGALLAMVAVLGCGCSGINATKSVSPMDFILPGLMKNAPSTPPAPNDAVSVPLLVETAEPPPVQPPASLRASGLREQSSQGTIHTAPAIASCDSDREVRVFAN
jgi:hypothetical protein